jgi:uncharacterized Zn-binding protein involved in type VI secretion
MTQICRTGDTVTGTCYNHDDPVSFTGTWDPKFGQVTANNLGVICKGDMGSTDCGHKFIADGSTSPEVIANGLPLQRVGDTVTVIGGGNGISVSGSPNVTSI